MNTALVSSLNDLAAVDMGRGARDRHASGINAVLMLGTLHQLEDCLVRLDTMGMRRSVEGRVPPLDPMLARWSFGLSQRQKINGYEQKSLFRQPVRPLLPEYILNRPKQGFCAPVAAWATLVFVERANGAALLVERGFLAPDAFERIRRDPSIAATFALWALGTLSHWPDSNL